MPVKVSEPPNIMFPLVLCTLTAVTSKRPSAVVPLPNIKGNYLGSKHLIEWVKGNKVRNKIKIAKRG